MDACSDSRYSFGFPNNLALKGANRISSVVCCGFFLVVAFFVLLALLQNAGWWDSASFVAAFSLILTTGSLAGGSLQWRPMKFWGPKLLICCASLAGVVGQSDGHAAEPAYSNRCLLDSMFD